MTARNATVPGWLSILVIALALGATTGAVLGTFGERCGLSAGLRVILGFLFVSTVIKIVIGRRAAAALRQQDER